MNFDAAVLTLGFGAQALFGLRLIVQLVVAERKKTAITPTLFWYLSLVASFLFLIYGFLRNDLVVVLGQIVSYYIYIRNLQIKGEWRRLGVALQMVCLFAPLMSVSAWIVLGKNREAWSAVTDNLTSPILIAGFLGQILLSLRFVYQWYFVERLRKSFLPVGFWVISVIASLLVLVYSIWHPFKGTDPVLIVAQSLGTIVYVRNMLIADRLKMD